MAARTDPIRVLLVDDDAMVRRGMRDFLALHDDFEILDILAKLGLASRTQAALLAVQHGLDQRR